MSDENTNMAVEQVITSTHPLKTLEPVPIDAGYIAQIAAILSEHGASMVETKDCSAPTLYGAGKSYKEFTLLFPDGTMRQNGLTMRRSAPFTIVFPDGYKLHAAKLWPLFDGEDDKGTIVLYISQK